MTTIFDLMQHPSIAALGWTLIHFLWQGALLGGAAFLILRVVRPERASTRYAIGVATLAAMVIACAMTFAIEMRPRPAAAIVSSTSSATFAPAVATSASARETSGELRRDLAGAASGREGGPSSRPIEPLDSRLLPLIVIAW